MRASSCRTMAMRGADQRHQNALFPKLLTCLAREASTPCASSCRTVTYASRPGDVSSSASSAGPVSTQMQPWHVNVAPRHGLRRPFPRRHFSGEGLSPSHLGFRTRMKHISRQSKALSVWDSSGRTDMGVGERRSQQPRRRRPHPTVRMPPQRHRGPPGGCCGDALKGHVHRYLYEMAAQKYDGMYRSR